MVRGQLNQSLEVMEVAAMEVMVDPMEATKDMVDMEVIDLMEVTKVMEVMEAIDLMEVTKDMEVIMDKVEPELQIKQSNSFKRIKSLDTQNSQKLEIF